MATELNIMIEEGKRNKVLLAEFLAQMDKDEDDDDEVIELKWFK